MTAHLPPAASRSRLQYFVRSISIERGRTLAAGRLYRGSRADKVWTAADGSHVFGACAGALAPAVAARAVDRSTAGACVSALAPSNSHHFGTTKKHACLVTD